MAIAVILDFDGGTLEQYDQVIQKMGLTGSEAAPGGISHWVAKTDTGIRVVDSWKDRETFDRFAQEQIVPYTQEVGLGQPRMEFYDVHNTMIGAPSS
jgi:hypothetical protein